MLFTVREAKKIVKRYRFLLGQEIADTLPIDHIIIAPADQAELKLFLKNLFFSKTGMHTFIRNGYENAKVQILIMHVDQFLKQIQYLDLDDFLLRNNLKRMY